MTDSKEMTDLITDAIRFGLTVEHDTRHPGRYIIGGIQVRETRFATYNFERVRILIKERERE